MSTDTTTIRRTFVEDGELGFGGQMIGGDGSGDAVSRRFIWERPDGMVDVVDIYAYAVDMWERFNIADDDQAREEACTRWDVEMLTECLTYESREALERGDEPVEDDPMPQYEYLEVFKGPETEGEAEKMAREWLASVGAWMLA